MPARYGPHLALLVVQIGALFMLGHQAPLSAGFPLDDSWIHQWVARTFAETGVLGAVPERPLSGATSVLWPVILSANPAFLGMAPSTFSAIVNGAFYVAAGQLLLHLLLRDGYRSPVAWTAAALAAISGNHVWFALSGMETSLIVCLMIAMVVAWTSPAASTRSAAFTGILLSLSFLARPETVVLTGVVVLSFRWCRRSVRDVLVALGPLALTGGAYALATHGTGPSTTAGRRWMWMSHDQGLDASVKLWSFGTEWAHRLGTYVIGVTEPAYFWLASGFALAGLAFVLAERRKGLTLLCAVHAAHVGIYALLMPVQGHGGRYQPLFTVLFLPLTFLGLARIVERALNALSSVPTRAHPAVVAGSGVVLSIPTLGCLNEWSTAHALAIEHIETSEVRMGQIVRELPANARVATFDVGGIGFMAGRPLLDLGALLDPALLPFISKGRTDELLVEREIDYLVLPMGYGDAEFPDPWNFMYRLGIGRKGSFRLRPIAMTMSPQFVWAPGLKATLHCSPRQVLFEVLR